MAYSGVSKVIGLSFVVIAEKARFVVEGQEIGLKLSSTSSINV